MKWTPIPDTKYFSKYGKGIYEEVCEGFYHRISPLDESEEFDFYRSHDNVTAFRYPSKPNREN